MTDLKKIARPYAQAAFEYAQAHGTQSLAAWASFLAMAAAVSHDAQIKLVLKNPLYSAAQRLALYRQLLDTVDAAQANFLALLSVSNRLHLLNDIFELYQHHCARASGILDVTVVSATVLTDGFQRDLVARLAQVWHKEIVLHCELDPELVGGCVIRMGDYVIDGSVKNQLLRLKTALMG